MKDIIGTIGNFEYGEYINRSQCYVNVRCLEYDYVLVMNTSQKIQNERSNMNPGRLQLTLKLFREKKEKCACMYMCLCINMCVCVLHTHIISHHIVETRGRILTMAKYKVQTFFLLNCLSSWSQRNDSEFRQKTGCSELWQHAFVRPHVGSTGQQHVSLPKFILQLE